MIDQLVETAPVGTYEMTDPEYMDAIREVFVLSLAASDQLRRQYNMIRIHKAQRDQQLALMLLNEALSRLSRGDFAVDEYGEVATADHDAENYDYDRTHPPDTACLGTRYKRLWDALPCESVVSEAERDRTDYFPNLAAGGLPGYPEDLSGSVYDDLEEDRLTSEAHLYDLRLLNTVVDFYTWVHAWRIFAEDYLEVSVDEFLDVTPPSPVHDGTELSAPATLDEQRCRNILSLNEDYLAAFPRLVEEFSDGDEEIEIDLNPRAQRYADQIAEDIELAV